MKKIEYNATGPRPYLQSAVQVVVVPSPSGGWNARDPVALMEPKYANILDNWVPRTGYVEVRPGYSAWAQNIDSGPVESLLSYRSATGEKLFAAINGKIYDVSIQGISVVAQTGMSNSRWQQVMFTPALGSNYLVICNGQDGVLEYNGTVWSTPTITGANPNTFINVAVWKRRLWFVQAQSTVAWYLGTDAIQGAVAGSVDIGALINKGGSLIAIGTITVDGGNGPDDLICFVTSRGEVVIYKGTDPTSSSAFSLVGVFYISPPLGNRCLMDYGSDLVMITQKGAIPISQALPVDASAVRGVAINNQIQNAMLQAAQTGQSNFGWEMIHYPAQDLVVMNVPLATDSNQIQFVMNSITGAWCRFVGWNANCFGLFDNLLYFGDDNGNVNLAWSGGADLVTPIVSDMQCAFNYFGDPGKIKQMTMIQPLLTTSGPPNPTLSVDVDFGSVSPTANVNVFTQAGSVYDTAIYDTSTYSGGLTQSTLWQGVQALGHALAVRMKVNLIPPGAGGQSVFDTGTFDMMVFDGFGTSVNTLQVNAFEAMVKFGGNL